MIVDSVGSSQPRVIDSIPAVAVKPVRLAGAGTVLTELLLEYAVWSTPSGVRRPVVTGFGLDFDAVDALVSEASLCGVSGGGQHDWDTVGIGDLNPISGRALVCIATDGQVVPVKG